VKYDVLWSTDQLMGFGFENKHNKKSLKIYPDTFGLLNVIKQLHFSAPYDNLSQKTNCVVL
jgi:hypothetical protein